MQSVTISAPLRFCIQVGDTTSKTRRNVMKQGKVFHSGNVRKMSVVLSALAVLSASMEAAAFQRNVSRTGADGRTASRSINTSRTADGYNRSTTYAGPQGNTASRSAQGQWDPATKTWTKSVTAAGSTGQSASRNTTVTRTDTGYAKSTTVTGSQGNSATRSVTGQWDPATKTWSKSVNTTRSGEQ